MRAKAAAIAAAHRDEKAILAAASDAMN